MSKYHQGQFLPKNIKKYKGDPTKIYYRSSWECQYMLHLDRSTDIVEWSSEETIIPYRSPADGQVHRYFVDFYFKNKKGEEYIIEIKPFRYTQRPKQPKRITQKFMTEVTNYVVNQSKWEAAEKFAKAKGWHFEVITEKELGILV